LRTAKTAVEMKPPAPQGAGGTFWTRLNSNRG
jgi:hypothetical protein